jgi:copper(I)-binding protein
MRVNGQAMTFSARRWLQALVMPLLIGALVACGSRAPAGAAIQAEDVWARPAMATGEMADQSVDDQMGMTQDGATSAVYFKLVNNGAQPDRLVSVQADVAESAEIHESWLEGDVMRMRPLPEGVEIPAQGDLEFKPGAYHVMLIGLKRDLQVGDRFPVLLTFEKGGTLRVEAEVRTP